MKVTHLALIAVCAVCASACGATHYVSLLGNHVPPFTNGWAGAATNIQAAVNVAGNGDVVLITNGFYYPGTEIIISNNITVTSLGDVSGTVVDGSSAHRCFVVASSAPGAIIQLLTLRNGSDNGGNGADALLLGGGTLRDCWLWYGFSTWSGGGVMCDHGGLVSNCWIYDSHAAQGGGVYCLGGGVVMACKLEANRANSHSGGVCCDNGGIISASLAFGNRAGQGGAIGMLNGGGVADNVTVSNNAALDVGGGVWCSGGGVLRSCAIVLNVASNDGGGLSCGGAVLVSNCTLSGNVAMDMGGGAHMTAGALTLDSSSIVGNVSSDGYGGGICLSGDVMLQATNTLIANNIAKYYGGGFFYYAVAAGRAVLDDIIVSNNTAGTSGGGGMFATTNTVVVRNAQFVDNRAMLGGGLMLENGRYAFDSVRIAGNRVAGHPAGDGGGGIVIYGGTLLMRDCALQNNDADSDENGVGNGGGLYAGAGAQPSSVTIEPRSSGRFWTGNHAVNGGAIYACQGATVTVATAGMVQGCGGNTASNGAVICLESGAYLQSRGQLLMQFNRAMADGGCICARNAACDLLASNGIGSVFYSSFAGHNGGAVMLDGSRFSAQNVAFYGNACSNLGGAIYLTVSTASVYGVLSMPIAQPPCTFKENVAYNDGGAVMLYYPGTLASLSECLIVSNRSETYCGGGASVVLAGMLRMANCVVAHNSAAATGGGISASAGGALYLRHCTIAHNDYGGIYSDYIIPSPLGMTNCIVWGNTGYQVTTGALKAVDYCDLQMIYPTGTGNISNNPNFANPAVYVYDYRLLESSPCRDTGIAVGVAYDCIGTPRSDGMPDLGAYEYVPEPGIALLLALITIYNLRFTIRRQGK